MSDEPHSNNQQDIEHSSYPHDEFFKYTLSKPEVFKDFMRVFFPDYYNELDLGSISSRPASHIDKRLKQYFSDLVYSANLKDGTQVKITILLEHKSYPDNKVLRQINRYILNLWEEDEKSGRLTLPLPILIYTGERRWQVKTLRNYFKAQGVKEKFLRFVPEVETLLVYVRDLDERQLLNMVTSAELFFYLYLSKYIHDNPERLLEGLRSLANYIKEMFEARDLVEALEIGLRYLSYFRNFVEPNVKEKVMETFERIQPLPNSVYMELITKGRREGWREGRREGQLEAKLEDAYRMYLKGLGIDLICEVTGLDETTIWNYIKQQKDKA